MKIHHLDNTFFIVFSIRVILKRENNIRKYNDV